MVAACGALRRTEFLESRSSTPACSRHPFVWKRKVAASQNSRGHPMQQTNILSDSASNTPLALDAFNGLLTVRNDVTSDQLHDEAQLRQNAAVGMLHALSSGSDLNTLENHLLLTASWHCVCCAPMRLHCTRQHANAAKQKTCPSLNRLCVPTRPRSAVRIRRGRCLAHGRCLGAERDRFGANRAQYR